MALLAGCSPAGISIDDPDAAADTALTTQPSGETTSDTSAPPDATTSTGSAPTTTLEDTTSTNPDTTSTTSPAPGQFSSWVGGGDPGPCDEEVGVAPPFVGLGYGSTWTALGSVIDMCFLGFTIKIPVEVQVEHPDGAVTSFQVWVGTNNESDPFTDPLAGQSFDSAVGHVAWVLRSSYAPGTYEFSASQGDVALSSQVEFLHGPDPYIEAVDRAVTAGDSARFAISGGTAGEAIPLYLYRDTGVLDSNHPQGCDGCSIFELMGEVGSAAPDENGGALFTLNIDATFDETAGSGTGPFGGDAYCLVTTESEPACDIFTGGWFEVGS